MFAGDGVSVGTIELVPWPAGRSTHPGISTNSTQNQSLSDVKNSSSLSLSPGSTTMTAEDARLKVRISLIGDRLPLFDVFTLIIKVLVEAGGMDATQRIRTYDSPEISARLDVTFREAMPARIRPPFFEGQWLMGTMALIPVYMIRKGVFQEAYVIVEVDGETVAHGFLGKVQAGVGVTNANGNVSVS